MSRHRAQARGIRGVAVATVGLAARPFVGVYRGMVSMLGVLPGIRADLRAVSENLEAVRAELVAIERRVATIAPDTAAMSRDVARLPPAIDSLDPRLESVEQDLGKVTSLIPKFRGARRGRRRSSRRPNAATTTSSRSDASASEPGRGLPQAPRRTIARLKSASCV